MFVCVDGPVISCQPASAIVGDREVRIQCEIRSRPDLSALFWIIDVNGTTVTEERGFHDFWSLVRVGAHCAIIRDNDNSIAKSNSNENAEMLL